LPQFRCAVPAGELPPGWQFRLRICGSCVGVFWLMNVTASSPLGRTVRSECPSRLQAAGFRSGLKKLPMVHTPALAPLIISGVDQVNPWSVDIEPQIGDSQNWSCVAPQEKSNTVHVKYTLSRFGLPGK